MQGPQACREMYYQLSLEIGLGRMAARPTAAPRVTKRRGARARRLHAQTHARRSFASDRPFTKICYPGALLVRPALPIRRRSGHALCCLRKAFRHR